MLLEPPSVVCAIDFFVARPTTTSLALSWLFHLRVHASSFSHLHGQSSSMSFCRPGLNHPDALLFFNSFSIMSFHLPTATLSSPPANHTTTSVVVSHPPSSQRARATSAYSS